MLVNRSFNLFSIISAGFGLAAGQRPFLKVEGEISRSDKGFGNFWLNIAGEPPNPISLSFGKDCIRCHKKSSSSCSEYGTLLFTLSLVLVSEVGPTHSGEGFTSFAKDVALDNSSWQEAGPRRWSRLFFTILLDFHLRKGRPGRVVQISCKIIALP